MAAVVLVCVCGGACSWFFSCCCACGKEQDSLDRRDWRRTSLEDVFLCCSCCCGFGVQKATFPVFCWTTLGNLGETEQGAEPDRGGACGWIDVSALNVERERERDLLAHRCTYV